MTPWSSSVSFLMCEPSGFDVRYQINPWMFGNQGQVDAMLAKEQWARFHEKLARLSTCVVMPGSSDWPDLVFTANAALISPNADNRKALLSQFRHPERQGEGPLYAEQLTTLGFDVVRLPSGYSFEGAGDALFDTTGRLWAAVGPRTDLRSHEVVKAHFACEIETVRLTNPSYYHLDTCFCPLGSGHCLAYLEAFDEESRRKIQYAFSDRLIELTHTEASAFSANAVEACGHLFMSECSPRLEQVLNQIGYRVQTSSLSEFLKAGGSAKCLTLALKGQSFTR